MSGKGRVLFLALIMAVIVVSSTWISFQMLYNASFEQQQNRLVEVAQSRASMIQAIASFDAMHSREDVEGGAFQATLQQIIDAHERFAGFGETGEFTLAKRQDEQIVFLLRHRHHDLENLQPVAFTSHLAEPMRRALSGKSGTVVGPDYRGERVLAAYEPVSPLNLGIVAKIDLAEIRAPFVTAGLVVAGTGILLILLGSLVFLRIGFPMVNRLEESEKKYRILFEQAADSVALVDGETGRFVEFNDKTHINLGYSRDEFNKLRITDVSINDSAEQVRKRLAKIIQNGSGIFTAQVKTKQDKTLLIKITARSIQLLKKNYILCIWQDITAAIKAEEKLLEQKQLLDNILANIPHSVFWKDLNSAYLGCNAHFVQDTGLESAEEIIGKTDFDLIWDKEEAKFYRACDKEVMDNDFPLLNIEETQQRADGSQATLLTSKVPLRNAAGQIIGIQGIYNDITQQKEAENTLRESSEKYASIIKNIGIGIVLISPEMKILEANDQIRNWFPEVDPDEQAHCFHALCKLPYAEACNDCPTTQTFADGEIHESIIKKFTRDKHGSYRVISSPIHDSDGKVTASIVILEDITERLVIEEKLRRSQKMEAIGTLAGGIAHDFNNILYSILGNTEIALEKNSNGEVEPKLKEVMKAAERATELVKQILSFSRHSVAEREPICCKPVIEETLKLLRATIPTSVEIRSNLKCDFDSILSSSTEIHQILLNLCANAAQALENDTGEIEVSLDSLDIEEINPDPHLPLDPGKYVVITVRDTGCGIPQKVIDRIFDPFYTSKAPGFGTGLGLSVVHGIVKELGGVVKVASKPNQGSRFSIYLPWVGAPLKFEEKETTKLPPGHGTLLLVDDEQALLDIQSAMLHSLGYQTVTCSNGRDALDLFEEDPQRFDLVITDQAMPKMTGDKLAEAMLGIRPDLPVILSTGYSTQATEERFKKQGIQKLLIKPVSRKTFAKQISDLLVEKPLKG